MRNYFNYFTEIEDRFQQRRGVIHLLSTLDWALIDMWREAGIPLEAALRGIDAAFDKYEQRQKRGRMRRINGLAWCAQAVMHAAEEMREASAGTVSVASGSAETGFEHERLRLPRWRPPLSQRTLVRLRRLACVNWQQKCGRSILRRNPRPEAPRLLIWNLSSAP